MEKEARLKLEHISKWFPGTRALSDVSLTVMKGEVHALVGENGAGKSTLVSIIAGVLPPDEGTMAFEGKEIHHQSPLDAQRTGISLVHQELSLCSHLNVAENIFIGRLPRNIFGIVDYKKLYSDSQKLLDMFKTNIKPWQKISDLNVAQQQIVEISKAISYDCKLLILDEPTSSLTENESKELFKIIRQLKENGTSIMYISHRLAEITDICDSISVLRDGQYIKTVSAKDIEVHQIVSLMVGRDIDFLYPPKTTRVEEELLRVEKLSSHGVFNNIDFSLNKGEILGFSGLVGSGRTEVMRAICAIDKKHSGDIYFKNKKIQIKDYKQAIDNGIVYMTEDRKQEGLFLHMSIKHNISASILNKIKNTITIDSRKEEAVSNEYVQMLKIKISSITQACGSLSGGNQQKVLFAKWLAAKPEILIIDEPTRGIDVNVKTEIYKLLRKLSEEGIGIIVVTSELPEAIGVCDRIIVMHEGKITGIVQDDQISEENIMKYAANV